MYTHLYAAFFHSQICIHQGFSFFKERKFVNTSEVLTSFTHNDSLCLQISRKKQIIE